MTEASAALPAAQATVVRKIDIGLQRRYRAERRFQMGGRRPARHPPEGDARRRGASEHQPQRRSGAERHIKGIGGLRGHIPVELRESHGDASKQPGFVQCNKL